jgi:ribosomal protein L11 methyltransferase
VNAVVVHWCPPEAVQGCFDVVIANILANPLQVLAPLLAQRTRPGGRIVLAGILDAQAAAVAQAYAPWFALTPALRREDWTCLSGKRTL